MVLETIIKPEKVEQNILWALPLGFILSTVGLAVGVILFPRDASLVGILFTTLAGVPFLRRILTIEEIKDERIHVLIKFFQRNQKVVGIYFMFFLGITLSYIILYYLLPADIVTTLFKKQLSIFPGATPTGQFLGANQALFITIISNNIKIAFIALVLSFLYGAGAIMILTWNASALAIFLLSLGDLHSIAFTLPHAAFEFAGFFIAAVAGGLISIAAERDNLFSNKFKLILSDGLILFLIAIAVIIFAALVEVTVGVLA